MIAPQPLITRAVPLPLAAAIVRVPMPLVPLGLRLMRQMRPTWEYRLAYAGMFLSGVKLLSDSCR